MNPKSSTTRRIGVVLLAGAAAVGAAQPARAAVNPLDVLAAVKGAYEAYQTIQGDDQGALDQATTKIVNSIAAAQSALVSHIDRIAVTQVRSCARSAVLALPNIARMNPDTLQAFARETTTCVTHAEAMVDSVTDKAAVDQVGFALNAVGPITLLAHARAGWDAAAVETTIRDVNVRVIARLKPPCTYTPLWDERPDPTRVEVELKCTAHNGNRGYKYVFVPTNQPFPAFNYGAPRTAAMAGTSHPVAHVAIANVG